MSKRLTVFLFAATLAMGQAAKPAAPQPPQLTTRPAVEPAKTETTSGDSTVITISGICGEQAANAGATVQAGTGNCKTVITKSEFEAIVNSLQPNMPPAGRKQLAERYAMALAFADKAHALGLDKGPSFEENLRLARLQVLAKVGSDAIQKKAMDVPDSAIEDYYKKNSSAYEEADLLRIYVPKNKQAPPAKPAAGDKKPAATTTPAPTEATSMEKEAGAIRTRAAAGEDFAKLQAEATEAAGQKGTPPNVAMGKIRRTSLPVNHAAVFDLQAGGVSQVIADPGAYFIYKLQGKDTLPLDKVRDEIRSTLQGQQVQESFQAIQQQVTLNDDYFKVAGPTMPASQGPVSPHATPPSSSGGNPAPTASPKPQ